MLEFDYSQYPFDSTSQIRLLELSYSDTGDPQWKFAPPITIDINLANTSVQTSLPPFAAISYEWGDAAEVTKLSVDGHDINVRRNLQCFLVELPELRKKANLPKRLWIDSICINQKNEEEMSNQIRLLQHVYRSAYCVVSWLGPREDFSELAMKYAAANRKERGHEHCVTALLERRYWSRLWMVQEVVLGRKWLVACGTDIISGDHLLDMFVSPSLWVSRFIAQWKDTKAYNLLRERQWYQRNGPSSLIELLLRFFESTNCARYWLFVRTQTRYKEYTAFWK